MDMEIENGRRPPHRSSVTEPVQASASLLPVTDLDQLPQPLAVGLRNTPASSMVAESICEFENAVFGPDFAYSASSIRAWFASGCFFCATMSGAAVAGRERVLAVVSALVTDEISQQRLLNGEISDGELKPWSQAPPGSQPTIYFASVISDNPTRLVSMYETLGDDLESYLSTHKLSPRSAFAVASGEAGLRHMIRNGFHPLEGAKYLGRYHMLTLDLASARTAFWQRLLHSGGDTLVLRAALRESVPGANGPAPQPGTDAEAREIQRRLTQSKTERYRKGMSF